MSSTLTHKGTCAAINTAHARIKDQSMGSPLRLVCKVPVHELVLLDPSDLCVAQCSAQLALALALLEVHDQQILHSSRATSRIE